MSNSVLKCTKNTQFGTKTGSNISSYSSFAFPYKYKYNDMERLEMPRHQFLLTTNITNITIPLSSLGMRSILGTTIHNSSIISYPQCYTRSLSTVSHPLLSPKRGNNNNNNYYYNKNNNYRISRIAVPPEEYQYQSSSSDNTTDVAVPITQTNNNNNNNNATHLSTNPNHNTTDNNTPMTTPITTVSYTSSEETSTAYNNNNNNINNINNNNNNNNNAIPQYDEASTSLLSSRLSVSPIRREGPGHSNTLSRELPVVHPFTGRVISRSSPAIKQLINAGFTIEKNAVALNIKIENIKFKSIKTKAIRRAVESFLEDPYGDDSIQSVLQSAGDSVLGTYLPPKLETLHDPILEEIVMTVDQQNVLNLVLSGYCVYIGGSAGTGKTVLLKAINRELSSRGIRTAMCATTGVASVQLGGSTFHYAFGVPMNDHGRWDVQSLRAVDVVVIDEVSLLDRGILEAFSRAAQLARLSDKPFGGMQVILCGDFMQLAMGGKSVSLPDNIYSEDTIDGGDQSQQSATPETSVGSSGAQSSLSEDISRQPCFMSPLFRHLVPMQLVTVLRHKKGDPLLSILRRLRVGEYVPQLEAMNKDPSDDSCATYIFPKRRSVNAINNLRLSALNTDMRVYTPQRGPTQLMGNFTESCIAHIPMLRKEAFHESVLSFLATHGYVRSAEAKQGKPHSPFDHRSVGSVADVVVMPVRFLDNQYAIRYRQPKGGAMYNKVPGVSKHVWAAAVTDAVLASGGSVLEFISEEPEGIIPHSAFMSGNLTESNGGSSMVGGGDSSAGGLILKLGCRVMVRRNLSRSVSNGSIGIVEAFQPYTQELQPKKRDDDANGGGSSGFIPASRIAFDRTAFPLLPVVRMQNGEAVQIPPVYEVVGGGPRTYFYGHALYTLPLQLGYAFTVHKVQGLTLDGPVVLDCEDFFNCPHLVYVACSRVRTLSQLTVKGLHPSKILIDPPSLQFAKSIPSAANPPRIPPDAVVASWAQKLAITQEG